MSQRETGFGCLVIGLAMLVVLVALVASAAFVVMGRRRAEMEAARAAAARAEAERQVAIAREQALQLQQREHPEPASIEDELRSVLSRQQQAWNRGDVESFMNAYWRSEELSFSSGGTTTYGWQATRDGYHRRYPTPAAMGQLSFRVEEVRVLAHDAALVLGNWELKRASEDTSLEDVGGNFSLVFRKIDDLWVIVHDHTSRNQTDDNAPNSDE